VVFDALERRDYVAGGGVMLLLDILMQERRIIIGEKQIGRAHV
jgi:hypothetical protein